MAVVLVKDTLDAGAEFLVLLLPPRWRTLVPGMVATGTDAKHPAEQSNGVHPGRRLDECKAS